jgi:hypothetical protein
MFVYLKPKKNKPKKCVNVRIVSVLLNGATAVHELSHTNHEEYIYAYYKQWKPKRSRFRVRISKFGVKLFKYLLFKRTSLTNENYLLFYSDPKASVLIVVRCHVVVDNA